MKFYSAIRDWVDRQWREVGRFRILILPAAIPLLLILLAGKTRTLEGVGWAWFAAWNTFVLWRYWIYMKAASAKADEDYDRAGKYRLASEYHDTESATAASKRKGRASSRPPRGAR